MPQFFWETAFAIQSVIQYIISATKFAFRNAIINITPATREACAAQRRLRASQLVRIYYIIIKSSFKFNKYCICHEIVFRGFVECTPPLIIIRNFGSLSSYHHPLFVILTRWFSSLKPIFPLNGINKFIIRYKRLESITH